MFLHHPHYLKANQSKGFQVSSSSVLFFAKWSKSLVMQSSSVWVSTGDRVAVNSIPVNSVPDPDRDPQTLILVGQMWEGARVSDGPQAALRLVARVERRMPPPAASVDLTSR